MELSKDLLSRQEVRDLVEKADNAGKILAKMSQEQIDAIVKAMAEAGYDYDEILEFYFTDITIE